MAHSKKPGTKNLIVGFVVSLILGLVYLIIGQVCLDQSKKQIKQSQKAQKGLFKKIVEQIKRIF